MSKEVRSSLADTCLCLPNGETFMSRFFQVNKVYTDERRITSKLNCGDVSTLIFLSFPLMVEIVNYFSPLTCSSRASRREVRPANRPCRPIGVDVRMTK